MSNPIHQEIDFAATPQRVYDALLDSKQFSEVSGAPADIGREAGAAFSCFGGMVAGRHLELVPGQLIVQAWRVGNWAPGEYSIVKFALTADGTGTRLIFNHTGFPSAEREHLDGGWHKMYWDKLKAYLA